MTQANDPAFPATDSIHPMTGERCTPLETGLTKREVFAKAAMQGLLASSIDRDADIQWVSEQSVKHADALIASLNKEK